MATDAPAYEPLELIEDPYPIYRWLREGAPVYRRPDGLFWALSRYDDVQAAARDRETFSSANGNDLDDTALLFAPGELTHADPPLHTRLRDSVRRQFGVSSVRESLEPVARATVRTLLGRLARSNDVDLALELADALPGSMICKWLGFPDEDHPQLIAWFHGMLERVPGQVALPTSALEARDSMHAYIRAEMVRRGTNPSRDLFGALLAAHAQGELSEPEVVGVCTMFFFAGITTTSALLSNSLLNLALRPSHRRQLRSDVKLIPAAVEEFLRFDAPIQWVTRTTTRAVELHGTTIGEGERVLLAFGSANRDERRWHDPDELIFDREQHRHIAFGEGIHHCLGAPLARLEARVFLEEFLPAVDSLEIAGDVVRQYTQAERTIAHLPAYVGWSRSAPLQARSS